MCISCLKSNQWDTCFNKPGLHHSQFVLHFFKVNKRAKNEKRQKETKKNGHAIDNPKKFVREVPQISIALVVDYLTKIPPINLVIILISCILQEHVRKPEVLKQLHVKYKMRTCNIEHDKSWMIIITKSKICGAWIQSFLSLILFPYFSSFASCMRWFSTVYVLHTWIALTSLSTIQNSLQFFFKKEWCLTFQKKE